MRVWCIAVIAVATLTAAVAASFANHAYIRCEACRAVAEVIGDKMNETAKVQSSYKSGHRLDTNNKVKMQDYESSELRAIEIMDGTCKDISEWKLRQQDAVRVVRKGSIDYKSQPKFYGASDRSNLDSFDTRMKNFCHTLLDEHDEAIVSAIKKQRALDDLANAICVKACGYCEPAVLRKGELEERTKWEKAEQKRLKEESEQAAAEAKAKEEEAARKKSEEAAATASTAGDKQEPASDAAAAAGTEANPEL